MTEYPKIIDINQCEIRLIGFRNISFSKNYGTNKTNIDINESSDENFSGSSSDSGDGIEELKNTDLKSQTMDDNLQNKESTGKQSNNIKNSSKKTKLISLPKWKGKIKPDNRYRDEKNLGPNLIIYQDTDCNEIRHLDGSCIHQLESELHKEAQDVTQNQNIGSNDELIYSPKIGDYQKIEENTCYFNRNLMFTNTMCNFKKFPELTLDPNVHLNDKTPVYSESVYVDPASFLPKPPTLNQQKPNESEDLSNSKQNSSNNIEQATSEACKEEAKNLVLGNKGLNIANSSNHMDDIKTTNSTENSFEKSKISSNRPIVAKRQTYLTKELNLLHTTDSKERQIFENNKAFITDDNENPVDNQLPKCLPRKRIPDQSLGIKMSADKPKETEDQNTDNKLNNELINGNDQPQASSSDIKTPKKPILLPKPKKLPYSLSENMTTTEKKSESSRSDNLITQKYENLLQNCDDSHVNENKPVVVLQKNAPQEKSDLNSENFLYKLSTNSEPDEMKCIDSEA